MKTEAGRSPCLIYSPFLRSPKVSMASKSLMQTLPKVSWYCNSQISRGQSLPLKIHSSFCKGRKCILLGLGALVPSKYVFCMVVNVCGSCVFTSCSGPASVAPNVVTVWLWLQIPAGMQCRRKLMILMWNFDYILVLNPLKILALLNPSIIMSKGVYANTPDISERHNFHFLSVHVWITLSLTVSHCLRIPSSC